VVRTAEGRLLHVPGALPGEVIRLGAGSDGPVLLSVDRASPDRRAPPCPHFGTCGGCALQHWDETAALAWKVERLRATLALERLETDILPVVTTAPGGRRRAALHARRGPTRTALPLLRRLAAPLLEHPKSAPALHVTVTDTGLDIDVTGVEARSGGLSADARQLAAEVAGQGDIARLTLAGDILFQQRQPVVRLGRARVVLPPGAFLQAAPVAEAAMAAEAVAAADGARRIADLFCGVGTLTFPLAEVAPVLAVDSSAPAIAALVAAVATAPGLHGITAETRDLFRRPVAAAELRRIDVIVFDPPRAGAIAQTAEIAQSGAARVVGVSCNPATFARDARRLVDEGFRLERVRPVDQFLWSPHLELVAVFSR